MSEASYMAESQMGDWAEIECFRVAGAGIKQRISK